MLLLIENIITVRCMGMFLVETATEILVSSLMKQKMVRLTVRTPVM